MSGTPIAFDADVPFDALLTFDGLVPATMSDVLDVRCFAALRSYSVAAMAAQDFTAWASTSVSHIFKGFVKRMIGGRNRGRLPFIEFNYVNTNFDRISFEGGTVTVEISLRVHVGCRLADVAATQTMDILLACLQALRSNAADNYMVSGEFDSIGDVVLGPWGHERDASLTVEFSWDRASYQIGG